MVCNECETTLLVDQLPITQRCAGNFALLVNADRISRMPRRPNDMSKPDPFIAVVARPFRVAFLIEDGDGAHDWLDAAFNDSFGRHGGRQSLVVPIIQGAIPPLYVDWLKAYDPDVVWLISTNNEELAAILQRHCSPIHMRGLKRQLTAEDRRPPRLDMRTPALTALSWLPFLRVVSGGFRARPESILDCYPQWKDDGLVTDNFGTLYHSFSRFPLHREMADIVKPLMLTPADAPEDRWRWQIKADEVTDGYAALEPLVKSGRLVTLGYLSNIHSQHMRVRNHRWADSFCMVLGDSFTDRVSCWNAGLLFDDADQQIYKTLRLPTSVISDASRIERVQKFINGNNWINRYGGGPGRVTVRSSSLTDDQLKAFVAQIGGKGSWCSYEVKTIQSIEECCPPTPDRDRLSAWLPRQRDDDAAVQVPLRHRTESVAVPRPFHLQHANTAHPMCSEGEWIAQCLIDRTNDNGRYANIRGGWWIPRRGQLCRLFLSNSTEGRITAGGQLAIPVHMKSDRIVITEPSDEDFFHYILHQPDAYNYGDIRSVERVTTPYRYSQPSDKGRYLKGVLGMFGSIDRAYEVLMHGFWRKQFARFASPADDQIPQITRTLQKRFVPQAGEYVFKTPEQWEKLARTFLSQAMNVRQPKHTVKLRALQEDWKGDLARAIDTDKNLHDRREKILAEANEELARSLQTLCHEGAFHQGHSWSCRQCGYKNWTALEALKMTVECQVCQEPRQLPIDMEFDFRMNEFLATCLREHDTLSVVWALGKLSRRPDRELIFVPQTALYRKYPEEQNNAADRELDLLCVLNGKLVFGEVKASLSEIDKDEIDNLVALAREYQPDIVVIGAMVGEQAKLNTRLDQVRAQLGSDVAIEGLLGRSGEKLEFYLP